MPTVATDDAARRQEFIWLGPVNSPWPFEARGRAWVMAVLLCPVLVVIAGTLAPRPLIEAAFPGPAAVLVTGLGSVVIGVGAGIGITRAVGRLISPARPLGHHLGLLGMEVAAPREPASTTHEIAPESTVWIEEAPTNRTTRLFLVPPITGDEDTDHDDTDPDEDDHADASAGGPVGKERHS